MLSMGPILDLAGLKTAFASLVKHAEPNVLPAFILWVEHQVSEFKVTGVVSPDFKTGTQDLRRTVNIVLDDMQKKCDSLETACGTQTSPVSQGDNDYHQQTPTDLSHKSTYSMPSPTRNADCPKMLPTDLSSPSSYKFSDYLKTGHYSPRKSMKSIIDNIVKEETLSASSYLSNSLSHMALPIMIPSPVTTIAQQHTSLAKLLTRGPMITSAAQLQLEYRDAQKHGISYEECFPHKKFRPDALNPSEEAVCMKKDVASVANVAEEGACFPQHKVQLSFKAENSSEKENKPSFDSQNWPQSSQPPFSTVTNALCDLLSSKQSRLTNPDIDRQQPDKLVIDEDMYDNIDFDSDMSQGAMTEEDLLDRSHQSNTCQVCGQSFQYRSSFRRHMKVHQGIFSHVCAVCGRKFTRKEHFVRHKCSRKPNKASRGAHVESTVTMGLIPRVEFPPMQSPDHRSEISYDSSCPESPAMPHKKTTHFAESRRKAAVPRKVMMMDEGDPENSFEDDMDGNQHMSMSPASSIDYSSPAKSVSNMSCPSPNDYHIEVNSSPLQQEQTSAADEYSEMEPAQQSQVHSPINETEAFDKGTESWSSDSYSEALDLSCPSHTSCSSPQLPERHEKKPAFSQIPQAASMPAQQEFTIDTGNYKVVTGSGDEHEAGEHGKFIKVVKQGNYLKLKEEAQIIGGQLCFVCPTCSKVFHRSSNFSRHMRIHRGVYSYVCPNCQRGFFRREHFQKHKCSRRGMSHTWDRKTKIDMVLAAGENNMESSDAEGGSENAESEESYPLAARIVQ